jgi:Aldo/keto reductase family
MTTINPPATLAGSYRVGDFDLYRIGYGAMQLAGPGVFGPPRDRAAAIEVLRTAVELGVNHIDTADAYGPYITNEIIREALFPYDDQVHIVTKVGVVRDEQGGWLPANSPQSLRDQVHDNLRRLGLDVLDVVNLRTLAGIDDRATLADTLARLPPIAGSGSARDWVNSHERSLDPHLAGTVLGHDAAPGDLPRETNAERGLADPPVAPYGQGDEYGQQAADPGRGRAQ